MSLRLTWDITDYRGREGLAPFLFFRGGLFFWGAGCRVCGGGRGDGGVRNDREDRKEACGVSKMAHDGRRTMRN